MLAATRQTLVTEEFGDIVRQRDFPTIAFRQMHIGKEHARFTGALGQVGSADAHGLTYVGTSTEQRMPWSNFPSQRS